MPLYEYECERCGHIQEVLQGYKEPAPRCEVCDQNLNGKEREATEASSMKRKVSRSSFILVGGGWAKDGYK
ncbi:MAG: hypothetical protein GOVbin1454_21 [Prokaryotic dsDNA virus sp.]|nr:MAG: hypothetical protein GOVbin1454_21 [Prokaryotic dsDNA virus sp.]